MAFVTHLLRVTIELMTAWIFIRVITHIMASFWRANIAPIMTWLLRRVTRAITQVVLAYRYCAFGDADFTAYYCAFSDTNFSCRYCRYNGAWFCVRNCRCNVVDFGVPLQRQSLRAVIGALYRVWWRAFCRPTYALQARCFLWRVIRIIRQVVLTRRYSAFGRGIFRAIISIILVFTCNQVQFI